MGETITVALKLPNGIRVDPQYGGFLLNGYNTPNATVSGGYGITTGIDKAAFEKWKTDMTTGPRQQWFPPFAQDLIIAGDKIDNVRAQADEQEETRDGFEGINPDKPGEDAEPTDEQKRENAKAKTAAENARKN